MYPFIKNFHSGWAYLVLLLLFIVTVLSLIGWTSKKEFTSTNKKLALFTLIFSHIQLLIGLILWFISPLGKAALSNMSDASVRLTAMEHPLTNIVAIILITIGWSKHKKLVGGEAIFKNFTLFYGLALLLILSRIPWHLWF
jgi:uncharacterized protein YacL